MSVLDQAQNFSGGPIAAARLRDRWARKEANATDEETREQYREAIADLEARYPDLEEVPVGGAEAFARERGHGAGSRSPVHEGRRRSGGAGRTSKRGPSKAGGIGAGSAAAKGKPKSVPGLSPGSRRSSSSGRRGTPRVDHAIAQTGIPAAVGSSGSLALSALGMTVGLGFALLLLESVEKPGAGGGRITSLIGTRIPKALERFMSPYADVFPSNSNSAKLADEGETFTFRGQKLTYNKKTLTTAASRLRAAGQGKASFSDAKPGTFGRPRLSPQVHVHR